MGERIIELFNNGKKMIDISRELNIPYNTVKSIVRRRNGSEKKEDVVTKSANVCLCCGKEIALVEGKKKRIFCSSNCRVKYWRLKNGKK